MVKKRFLRLKSKGLGRLRSQVCLHKLDGEIGDPDKGHLGGEGKDLRLTPWAAGQGMWEEGRLAGNPHAFSEANRGKNKPG